MVDTNWFDVWGAIVVLIIGGIIYYTYKEISRAKSQQNRRRSIYENSLLTILRSQADGSSYSLLEAENPDDERQRAEDTSDEIAAATRTLTVWTAVLASATVLMAYFAYFTLDAIRDQLNEMRDEQRPWIAPGVNLGGNILVYRTRNTITQITVPIHFTFDNTGHVPAIATYGAASITGDILGSIVVKERQQCDVTAEKSIFGGSVFPQHPIYLDAVILDLFGTTTLTLHPTIDLSFITGGEAIRAIRLAKGHQVLDSIIFGCIIYHFGNHIGKSGFAYRLFTRGDPNQLPDQEIGRALILDGNTVPRDTIDLSPVIENGVFFAE
jgi:hypothetical protein